MDDEIIIILTDPPRPASEFGKGEAGACHAERFNAGTAAGLRSARQRIGQLLRDRFGETADEE